jgi:hypothetical protein
MEVVRTGVSGEAKTSTVPTSGLVAVGTHVKLAVADSFPKKVTKLLESWRTKVNVFSLAYKAN